MDMIRVKVWPTSLSDFRCLCAEGGEHQPATTRTGRPLACRQQHSASVRVLLSRDAPQLPGRWGVWRAHVRCGGEADARSRGTATPWQQWCLHSPCGGASTQHALPSNHLICTRGRRFVLDTIYTKRVLCGKRVSVCKAVAQLCHKQVHGALCTGPAKNIM